MQHSGSPSGKRGRGRQRGRAAQGSSCRERGQRATARECIAERRRSLCPVQGTAPQVAPPLATRFSRQVMQPHALLCARKLGGAMVMDAGAAPCRIAPALLMPGSSKHARQLCKRRVGAYAPALAPRQRTPVPPCPCPISHTRSTPRTMCAMLPLPPSQHPTTHNTQHTARCTAHTYHTAPPDPMTSRAAPAELSLPRPIPSCTAPPTAAP